MAANMPPPMNTLGAAFGIHPVHLGIIFIANLELGFLTPLVGLNIFLASYRFKRPVLEVCAAALPMMAAWYLNRGVLPPQWASAAGPALASISVYILMTVMLVFRPQGLFPART